MSQNEIKIKATLDESQFEREAEAMARSMDKMYERSYATANNIRQQQTLNQNVGGIGLPTQGSASSAQFQQAQQQGDKRFRDEAAAQMRVIDQRRDQIKKHADAISSLEAEQSKYNKKSQEALEIEKRITKEKENQMSLERDLLQRQTQMNQIFKQKEKGEQGTGGKMLDSFANGGGVQGALKTGVEAIGGSEAMLALGAAGAAAFAIRQITNVADGIIRQFASEARVTNTAQAGAVSGTSGNYLSQAYAGRSVFETANAGERSGALKSAMGEEGKLRDLERVKAGDWDMAGTETDPMQGGLSLAYGGMNALFGDEMQSARFMGSLGSEGQMNKYNSMSTERMVKNYQQNMESAKAKDPSKQLALAHYEGTHNRDLGQQRQLGLSDDMMYGSSGFMRSYQDKGYTNEQGMGAMNNIMNAGGSTRMGRDPATALAFAKNLDLTNSDSSLGKLSNNYGDTAKSKSALIEIAAEGTRLGLNKSEFREEQRKFTEAATTFLAKGYSGSDSDMERLMGVFGGGLNAKTGAGITAASNSADIVSGVASSGTGPEGALGFSSLISSKVGKRLSDQSQQRLNTMSLGDMTTSNPSVVGMAMEASRPGDEVKPEDIINEKMNSVKNKLFRNKDMQSQAQKAVKMKDIFFPNMSNAEIAEAANDGDPKAKEVINALAPALNYVANAYQTSGNQKQTDSLTDSLAHFGDPGYNMSDDSRALIEKKLNGRSDRTGDNVNEGIANDDKMATDKTNAMLGDFNSMADISKKMSAEMLDAMRQIETIANGLKGLTGEAYETALKKATNNAVVTFGASAKPEPAKNQAQGGKK